MFNAAAGWCMFPYANYYYSSNSTLHQYCAANKPAYNLVQKEMRGVGFGLVGGPVPSRKLVDHMNHPRRQCKEEGGEMAWPAGPHH